MTRVLPVLLLAAALTACAGYAPQPDRLGAMQSRVSQAEASPDFAQHAPVALREARQSLDRARTADSQSAFEHWLFMADSRLQLAEALTADRIARGQGEALAQRLQIEGARRSAAASQGGGKVFTFGEVLFETGQAQLKPGAYARLQTVADLLRRNPDERAVIQGHTDAQGSADTNQALSQARAEAVKQALLAAGISADRITAQGMGEAFPVASNDTAAGRQQNRRVEVQVSAVPER
ncbi:OmpA family protein [Magnetospirillum sp. UT-4]|uniref:OmpA family protein n=1 Tax=Magnetospirillum sp. UT-4 TaxID=2681467 RepID=UPI0013824EC7|nr:OmpA family protein [Magnetospirillum sp. UT-4]CAA7622898.1 putative OmpA/MotB domain-containing protein [Magnetospirillum sp. UT-4]